MENVGTPRDSDADPNRVLRHLETCNVLDGVI